MTADVCCTFFVLFCRFFILDSDKGHKKKIVRCFSSVSWTFQNQKLRFSFWKVSCQKFFSCGERNGISQVFLGLFVLFNTITIKNKLFILYSDPAFINYSKNKTQILHSAILRHSFEYGFVLTLYLFSFIFSFFNSISCKIIGSQQVTKNNLFSEIWKQ